MIVYFNIIKYACFQVQLANIVTCSTVPKL